MHCIRLTHWASRVSFPISSPILALREASSGPACWPPLVIISVRERSGAGSPCLTYAETDVPLPENQSLTTAQSDLPSNVHAGFKCMGCDLQGILAA